MFDKENTARNRRKLTTITEDMKRSTMIASFDPISHSKSRLWAVSRSQNCLLSVLGRKVLWLGSPKCRECFGRVVCSVRSVKCLFYRAYCSITRSEARPCNWTALDRVFQLGPCPALLLLHGQCNEIHCDRVIKYQTCLSLLLLHGQCNNLHWDRVIKCRPCLSLLWVHGQCNEQSMERVFFLRTCNGLKIWIYPVYAPNFHIFRTNTVLDL